MSQVKLWFVGSDDVRFRLPLLYALRDRGFDVGAVGSESETTFAGSGIPYCRFSLNRWVSPWSDLRSRRQLYDLFRAGRPDVVHAFDTKPAIMAPLAARDAGVPATVITITGLGYLFSSNSLFARSLRPAYRFLQRRAAAATGITIFQNSDDREYFYHHGMVRPGCDAMVRGSGIDFAPLQVDPASLAELRRELGLQDRLVVTMVSRLVRHKGVTDFLAAASLVRQRAPHALFLLIGPASTEGRSAVSSSEIERSASHVRYLGSRRDVPALLALSDLFVLPTYYREGVPRALLEAGALGLPLITTDTPGCNDVVRDGWNGLLVPPRDPEKLAAAVLRLAASPDERRLMGSRSRAHVIANFSLGYVADAYAGIYERVLRDLQASDPCRAAS